MQSGKNSAAQREHSGAAASIESTGDRGLPTALLRCVWGGISPFCAAALQQIGAPEATLERVGREEALAGGLARDGVKPKRGEPAIHAAKRVAAAAVGILFGSSKGRASPSAEVLRPFRPPRRAVRAMCVPFSPYHSLPARLPG